MGPIPILLGLAKTTTARGASPASATNTATDSRAVRAGRRRPMPAFLAGSVTLLLAACGGSHSGQIPTHGSTTRSESSSTPNALAFARCMRSHGVSKYPDPTGHRLLPSGLAKVSLHQLGVSNKQFQAAENDCRRLLPNGGQAPSQSEQQQVLDGMLRFSECMRAHGLPNWPDPTNTSSGPVFNLLHYHGVDPDSPQGQAAARQCQHLMPSQFNDNIPVERPG
jgi:hypothetical protein